jgi:hypothetical protein
MGHFSFTCSVSGLAITGGTPVRCLLLVASPYGDDDDSRNAWVVRTPPIRARYNDYGSIEDINKEDEFTANLWLRGLCEDLVEKGPGDNQCHDVPATKDMTFDQLLMALWERRIEVVQDAQHFWRRPMPRAVDDDAEPTDQSVPMFKRIKRLLGEGYTVDEPVPYLVRVRFGRYMQGAKNVAGLKKADTIVTKAGFVTMIAAGSGRYADCADLLVTNPPSKDQRFTGPLWDMASGQKAADDKRLPVRLAMVREDVWQAAITYPWSKGVYLDCTTCGQEAYYHKKNRQCPSKMVNKKPLKPHKKGSTYTHGPVFPPEVEHRVLATEYGETVWYGLDAFKVGVRAAWKKVLAHFDKQGHPAGLVFGDYLISDLVLPRGDDLGSCAFHSELPGVISIGDHLSMCLADKQEVPTQVIDSMAELMAFQYAMRAVGAVWKPAIQTGPQDPEWTEYVRFNETLAQISKKEARRHEKKARLPTTLGEAFKRFAPTIKPPVKRAKRK